MPTGTVRVVLLGEIAVSRDGAGPVAVPGARARLLVAALATHSGRSRSATALIEDVWGEQPPRAPMNALHTQVSRLRSLLPDGALEVGPAGYRLTLTEEQIDLTLARRLERQARERHAAGDDAGCLELVVRARALWRGEPGADLPPGPAAEDLAEAAATRWHALDELESASREKSGDFDGAVRIARRIAAARPLDEPAHGTLMRLLAAAGRGNEALEVFASVRARLAAELGANPGPALAELNMAILRGESMISRGRSAKDGDRSVDGVAPVNGSRSAAASRPVDSASPSQGFAAPPDSSASDASPSPLSPAASSDAASPNALSQNTPQPFGTIGLRAAPNQLLGRATDLVALDDLLIASRVTTVLGPGGTGKTRVANELGQRTAQHLPVVLVELASVRAAPDEARAEVETAIGAALGVAEVAREGAGLRPGFRIDARQRLRDAVAARPMLLILDNCEHLIDAVAEVVADLVGACDRLTVLTTSRAPLEITAEAVYPLPPLTIDEHGSPATELFAARARAVRPSVRLDPAVVARLCRTLDGLPLAIELAAARVRTMSAEEIEARLEHRFTLLRSGDRSSPQRHRTLHAVIDWSWNLLDEPQRIALRRLCRFPAGFTFTAAELVADGPEVGDIAAAVDGLVGQSLLSVLDDEFGGIRYRMLETVREFGEERLTEAGETDLVMDRMALWAKDLAIAAYHRYTIRKDQVPVVLEVGVELDNLLAVLRHALDRGRAETVYTVFPLVGMLWALRGAHGELIGWMPRVLAVPPPPAQSQEPLDDLQMSAQAMLAMHMTFGGFGLRDGAVLRTRIRRLLRGSTTLTPGSRFIGEMLCLRPTPMRVARKLSEGVRSPDLETRTSALMLRANLRENAGDLYGSMRDAQCAKRDVPDTDVWSTAMLYQHLAQLSAQTARYRESAEHYRRAVDALQQFRCFDEVAEISSYLAISLVGAGEPEQARQVLEQAAGFVEGDAGPEDPVLRPNQRRAALQVGWFELALAQGDVEAGLRRARRALELLAWPAAEQVPGPGTAVTAAAVLHAHLLNDGLDAVPRLPQELVDFTRDQFLMYIDRPQIGSVAVAIGSYLLTVDKFPDTGRELIVLGLKVKARQDVPSARIDRHLARHAAATTEELMAPVRERVARLGRSSAGDRILALFEQLSGKL
ncbi:AfsR/SARP family transcriptional regulator [Nocardia alni]|uniref:AfsR/SARP family transcriptional regulator n=1 Tax=Nocardia alni TaxID=2815723 RepID=UPI0027E01179|nr:BTAD domain-containing putative transcriptional regulator [Nocardia alni]